MIYWLRLLFLFFRTHHNNPVLEEHSANWDPELKLDTIGIIKRWGYPAETHSVTTADGYILDLHRIPHGGNDSRKCVNRPVVFMMHGLESASHDWVINLPHQSAGFFYADHGFDVWLGNCRGNTYGKKHVNLSSDSAKFWSFTWDEMAEFDLPAMIDYVLRETNHSSLHYFAHSQGTLAMFARLSEDVILAKKLKRFYAFAPIGRVKDIKGLIRFASDWLFYPLDIIHSLFGAGEFLPSDLFMKAVADVFCTDPSIRYVCKNVMYTIGGSLNQVRLQECDVHYRWVPQSGTSARM